MSKIKIITPQGELELSKDIGFGINVSIDDLTDVSKKNSAYSKTILLPGTKSNNILLGNLFDVNSTFTFFNPNFKVGAKLVLDGTVIIDGFMQLLEVKKLNNTDLQGNKIQYSVKLNDNVMDFYSSLKGLKLSDLDFSEMDHILTRTNVTDAWDNNTWDNGGYQYPMLFNDSDEYQTNDFKAAVYHKTYLSKILGNIGYSIGGTFYNDNTDYEKEIIPYNGDKVEISEAEITKRSFKALNTGDQTIFNANWRPNWPNLNVRYTFRDYKPLDNDSVLPGFDNDNQFDTTTNIWTVKKNGTYNLDGVFNLSTEFNTLGVEVWKWGGPVITGGGDPTSTWNGGGAVNYYIVDVHLYINGVDMGNHSTQKQLPQANNQDSTFNSGNGYSITHNTAVVINRNNAVLEVGDTIQWKFRFRTVSAYNNYRDNNVAPVALTDNTQATIRIRITDKANSYIMNEPLSTTVTDDDLIEVKNYIPKSIKQTDIIDDIVKRYNLIIRVDPENNKRILLDSRDDFYAESNSTTIDWTDKKDYSNQDSIKLLSELQNKEMLFTYKKAKDSDTSNTSYSAQFSDSDIYGQKKIEFPSDFKTGVNKIESKFSPTPMIYNSLANTIMIVPAIDTQEPKTNIRLLYWGGMKDVITGSWTFNSIDVGVPNTTSETTYPYAGHFDDPYSPTVDINWGENPSSGVVGYFYNDYDGIPNNNLYNKYWRNTVNQLTEGRLVTSKFHLTEVNVAFIKNNMQTRIWVKDSYYNINKISDYNPLGDGLTKVELVKINAGTSFVAEKNISGTKLTKWEYLNRDDKYRKDNETKSKKSKNTIDSPNTKVIGDKNRISEKSNYVFISGRDNFVGTENNETSIISGSNNSIGSGTNNSMILGSTDSTIESGADNSFIIGGSNQVVSQPNTTQIGDLVTINNQYVKIGDVTISTTGIEIGDSFSITSPNLIEGGFDEVRTLFPQNVYTLLEGGLDEVRTPFPENIPYLVDGGSDSV